MKNNMDMEKYLFYKKIFWDKSEIRIWKKLDNGCYIGTMGYSEENVRVLYTLLKSFEQQYGEIITMDSAREELKLYEKRGKLFIYFDQNMNPVSMNGVSYNENNKSIYFYSLENRPLNNLYFYGLSTIPSYRGKGACRNLISFVKEYAIYNDFDFIYARTDLINSNSEWIMEKAGMSVCEEDNMIITEWVDVTCDRGDYRLHLWVPLKDDIYLKSTDEALFADINTREIKQPNILKRNTNN